MEETCIKIARKWKYLSVPLIAWVTRLTFFLAAKQDLAAARRFLESVIDESGANRAAIAGVKADA